MGVQMTLDSPLRRMADAGVVVAGADAICTGLLAARSVTLTTGRSGLRPSEDDYPYEYQHEVLYGHMFGSEPGAEDPSSLSCDERLLRTHREEDLGAYLEARDEIMDTLGEYRFWRPRATWSVWGRMVCHRHFRDGETLAHEAGDIELCNALSGPNCCCTCCMVSYEESATGELNKRVRCGATTSEEYACAEVRRARSVSDSSGPRFDGYELTDSPLVVEQCNASPDNGPDHCCECCVAQTGIGDGLAGLSVRGYACASWTHECRKAVDTFGNEYYYHPNAASNPNCQFWSSKRDWVNRWQQYWDDRVGVHEVPERPPSGGGGGTRLCRGTGKAPGHATTQACNGGCSSCKRCCCEKPDAHLLDRTEDKFECCVGCCPDRPDESC